jgi:hypothetical protein
MQDVGKNYHAAGRHSPEDVIFQCRCGENLGRGFCAVLQITFQQSRAHSREVDDKKS